MYYRLETCLYFGYYVLDAGRGYVLVEVGEGAGIYQVSYCDEKQA